MGTFRVLGAPETLRVLFQAVNYPVLVQERGLPEGTTWEVTVGSTVYTASNTTLPLSLPNGTYPLKVGPETGYSGSSTPSSALTLNGTPATVSVFYNVTSDPAGRTGPSFPGSWQSVSLLLFFVILALSLLAYLLRRHRSRRHR